LRYADLFSPLCIPHAILARAEDLLNE
jgi:hypothetical protein